MATPKRQEIDDAVYTALNASTSIGKIHRETETWTVEGRDDFPSVCFIGGPEEKTRLCYPHATADDMQSIYPFRVAGAVQNVQTSSRIDEQRSELAQAIESAVTNSTGVNDLVKDVTLNNIDVDNGGLAKHKIGLVYCDFIALYHYNHNNP